MTASAFTKKPFPARNVDSCNSGRGFLRRTQMENTTNYKLTISYDGTGFQGWQKLSAGKENTVQGRLEAVASKLNGFETTVTGAGRTDAGVHALGQVANVRIRDGIGPGEIKEYFNRYLPETIVINGCEPVSDRFNARLSAKAKTYDYYFTADRKVSPFERKYVYCYPKETDVAEMAEACRLLEGTYDFRGFASAVPKKKNTVRTITEASVSPSRGIGVFTDEAGELMRIRLTGDGFLYNQVRIIAGTLLEIGSGSMRIDDIKTVIETCDRSKAGFTAPPRGLFLVKVYY